MDIYSPLPGLAVIALVVGIAALAFRLRPTLRNAVLKESSSGNFLPQLEGLRGLMAATVMVHHAVMFFIAWPRQRAWKLPLDVVFYAQLALVPVLIFFFLTGFLFWSKLLRQPHIQIGPFLRARFRRLGPVYLFTMALLFLWVAVLTQFKLNSSPSELIWSATKWLSFTLLGRPDVNQFPATGLLIAGTPWTLAFEWKFYFLLLALPWFARKTHRSLYLLGICFFVYEVLRWNSYAIFRVLPAWLQLTLGDVLYMSAHMTWSFGVGIIVASLRHKTAALQLDLRRWPITILCILLLADSVLVSRTSYFDPALSVVAGLAFLAIAYGNDLFGLLRSKAVMTLGRFSYSLYLCHGLVFSAIFWTMQRHGWPQLLSPVRSWILIAVVVSLATIFAIACHELVEAPYMRKRKPSQTGLSRLLRRPAVAS